MCKISDTQRLSRGRGADGCSSLIDRELHPNRTPDSDIRIGHCRVKVSASPGLATPRSYSRRPCSGQRICACRCPPTRSRLIKRTSGDDDRPVHRLLVAPSLTPSPFSNTQTITASAVIAARCAAGIRSRTWSCRWNDSCLKPSPRRRLKLLR